MKTEEHILLHVCCGPCATHAIEVLLKLHRVTLFFSNSNIAPKSEYDMRLRHARRLVVLYHLPMVEDAYDHDAWLAHIKGLEREPEKGQRCVKCFEFNLARAARHADTHGFHGFTTTLTISPHKHAETIFAIGHRLGRFRPFDFKEDHGFDHSVELSRQHGLYRQNYCGCEFSMRD